MLMLYENHKICEGYSALKYIFLMWEVNWAYFSVMTHFYLGKLYNKEHNHKYSWLPLQLINGGAKPVPCLKRSIAWKLAVKFYHICQQQK